MYYKIIYYLIINKNNLIILNTHIVNSLFNI